MLPDATVSAVIAKLEQHAREAPEGIIATDADGTLWSGDVGCDVFEAMLARGAIRQQAGEHLRQQARSFGIDDSGSPSDIAQRLYRAEQAGAYPEELIYEVMAWCMAGFTPHEAQEFARDVHRSSALANRLHGEMQQVLAWASGAGVAVWVVSASPQPVVETAVELLGIEAGRVVAACAAVETGLIQPRMAHPLPYGPAKVQSLLRMHPEAHVLGAFGDNVFDIELLSLAQVRAAVRPKKRLLDQAHRVSGLVRLVES